MRARFGIGLMVVLAVLASLCTVRNATAAEGGKKLIFEGSGTAVVVDVPTQFVAQLDELMTNDAVLKAKGLEAEADAAFGFDFSKDGSPTRIANFAVQANGIPLFYVQITSADRKKMIAIARSKYITKVSPPPPGLELALQNARQSAVPAPQTAASAPSAQASAQSPTTPTTAVTNTPVPVSGGELTLDDIPPEYRDAFEIYQRGGLGTNRPGTIQEQRAQRNALTRKNRGW